jgi:hypothetical protein
MRTPSKSYRQLYGFNNRTVWVCKPVRQRTEPV